MAGGEMMVLENSFLQNNWTILQKVKRTIM